MNLARHTRSSESRRSDAGRSPLLTVLCALAFLLQSFVIQTHIHVASGVSPVPAFKSVSLGHPGRAPVQTPREDLSKCPLCHVSISFGSAIGPALIQLSAPVLPRAVPFLREPVSPAQLPPVHMWKSRAPPQR